MVRRRCAMKTDVRFFSRTSELMCVRSACSVWVSSADVYCSLAKGARMRDAGERGGGGGKPSSTKKRGGGGGGGGVKHTRGLLPPPQTTSPRPPTFVLAPRRHP